MISNTVNQVAEAIQGMDGYLLSDALQAYIRVLRERANDPDVVDAVATATWGSNTAAIFRNDAANIIAAFLDIATTELYE